MEIRILRYFLAVARAESISRAAATLHLSQPTLSTQIKQMEERLGKKLLVRGTPGSRRVTLTDDGRLLCKRAAEIIALVEKTEAEITTSDKIIRGDVYIGAGETDGLRVLARAAHKLQMRYPLIHYHIYSGNADFVTERLDNGLVDFGIVFGSVDSAKYEAVNLPNKDIWGALMRRDCHLASRASVTPEDLQALPLIVSHQKNQGPELREWFGKKWSEINVVATYNLLFNASLLVEEGLGCAICFDKIINTVNSDQLTFRPLDPPIEILMRLIWKKGQLFSKAAEMFLESVRLFSQP